MLRLLMLFLCAVEIAACATIATSTQALPVVPATFHESGPQVSNDDFAQPRADWWTVFADPVLDRLVFAASERNTGLQQAAARVAQARALAHGTNAERVPRVGVVGGAARQGGPVINAVGGNGTLIDVAATLSYEVDLFGRLSRIGDAAQLDVRTREAASRSTTLLLQAEVAQTFFALRAIDDERALVRATATAYRETLALVERRRRSGFASDQDVARMRAETGATDADAYALDRRRAELEHAMAFITGEPATTFRLDSAAWDDALPTVPPGIPSIVLARRPDVDAAERAMEAARLRVGIAETAWLPTLELTASGGYASSDLTHLLRSVARNWSIGGLLAATLFDGGRREAGIEGARADLELAFAGYREQVLVAFRDVEDQLSALHHLADQAEALRVAVESSAAATTRYASLYARGLVGQLDLLDARRTELRSRRAALQVRAARYVATVALVRALGGGWDAEPTRRLGVASSARPET